MIDFTKEEYMKYVEKGYISRKEHPEDSSVVILNYTELTVFERKWDNITLACRGLILQEKNNILQSFKILANPFPKFFNYGESMGDSVLALPKTNRSPDSITIKQDGSLGISYIMNGEVRWATRGSFISEQAKIAQEIWDRKYKGKVDINKNVTMLVEIIHPQTRVVVDYEGLEDLVLIGLRNMHPNQHDYSYGSLKSYAKIRLNNMPVARRVDGSVEEILEIAKTLDHNEEGFVLRWDDGYRLKVKGDKYLEVHRIIYGMSLKQKVESWANGNLDEYVKALPEEFRPEIEETAENCEQIFNNMLVDVARYYVNAEKRGRKNFALWVQKHVPSHLQGFMWFQYDNQIEQMNDKMKYYISKNYRELLGGDANE